MIVTTNPPSTRFFPDSCRTIFFLIFLLSYGHGAVYGPPRQPPISPTRAAYTAVEVDPEKQSIRSPPTRVLAVFILVFIFIFFHPTVGRVHTPLAICFRAFRHSTRCVPRPQLDLFGSPTANEVMVTTDLPSVRFFPDSRLRRANHTYRTYLHVVIIYTLLAFVKYTFIKRTIALNSVTTRYVRRAFTFPILQLSNHPKYYTSGCIVHRIRIDDCVYVSCHYN